MAAAFATTTPWLLKASSLGGFKGPPAVLVRASAEPVTTGADEDDWYEVPVHKVTVKDRQKGVTHSFFVPEVRASEFFLRGFATSGFVSSSKS